MPTLTHEQMETVEHGDVAVVETNVEQYGPAGGERGKLHIHFDPSREQLHRLNCGDSVLYEADAKRWNEAGQSTDPVHVRLYPPACYYPTTAR